MPQPKLLRLAKISLGFVLLTLIGLGSYFLAHALNGSPTKSSASIPFSGTPPSSPQTFTITQVDVTCTYALSSSSASYNSAGGPGSVNMTAPGGCSCTATTASTWIHTPSSAVGNGSLAYSVDANASTSSRLGTIAAGGQTFTITQAGNLPPVANPGPNRTIGVGTAVAFSGAGSSDPDGSITSYNWNFGDLSSASGISVSHAYASAGTYVVNLTVTDNLGATGSGAATVVVPLPSRQLRR